MPCGVRKGIHKMAGNTRGKIKEHLEGIHRNCDWQMHHCSTLLMLIMEKNPTLKTSIETLAETIKAIDDFAMSIYSKI